MITDLEKEVLELSKTLAPIPEDIMEESKYSCVWQDWDVNCHYADNMTIGDVCGRFQVYRHFDIEMEKHDEPVDLNHPESYPDWIDLVYEQGYDLEDSTFEEDGVTYGMAYADECEVYCEWGQHWLDTTTGEVVFLGRPWKDAYHVGEQSDPLIVIHPDGRYAGWYHIFNADYGNLHHYDYRLHENLLALGNNPLDTRWTDFEYEDEGFNDWYQKYPWHERVMKQDYGLREEPELERFYKVGGWDMLVRILNTKKGKDRIQAYFDAYKICLRNKYDVEDFSYWFRIVDMLVELKKDYHNPKFVCPKNLREMFWDLEKKVDAKARKKRDEERRREEKRKIEEELATYAEYGKRQEREYAKTHAKYLKINFEYKGIKYAVLQDVRQYLDLGIKMHNCVYYAEMFEKTDTIVLESTIDGKTLELIEFDLLTGKVVQSYGKRNQETKKHEDVVAGMEKNGGLLSEIYWQDAV